MLKRLGIAALVLVVLVAGLVGVVLAQGATPPETDVCPFGGTCGAYGAGGYGMGGYGMGGYGMGGYGYAGSMPGLLAEALGMTPEELYAAQASGQTVAQIAAAQGVELADVVAAVIAPQADRLAQSVANGYLTQEQADSMLAAMTQNMTARFEAQGLGYGGGCGMMGGGMYGPSNEAGTYGPGRRGGMRGGRWSAPQTPNTAAPSSGL